MDANIPVLAGTISTIIFATSAMPMLAKAARTKDLASYSLGNIVLSNLGNAIHSVYVFSMPVGPIWFLHTFYLVSTALMLTWYVRYVRPRRARPIVPAAEHYTELPSATHHADLDVSPDAVVAVPS